jgi:uncharacterized LabA/DUF88 family protein
MDTQTKITSSAIGKIYKMGKTNNRNMLPSDPSGSLDESLFSENTLVFIDAGFLSKLSKYFGNGKYLVYNIIEFSKNLANKEKKNCKKIFYYTAPPFQSNSLTKLEMKKKENYDKFLKKLIDQEVIVRESRCQRLKIDGEFIYKQKAVDILITIDLMNVLIKFKDIKKIILIASDSDFVPVIENLKENGIKTILHTYYDKKRNTNFSRSNDLIKSVHKYVLLSKKDFDEVPLG